MQILFLADRISVRGGADHYLLQMMHYASTVGHRVQVAAGRIEKESVLPQATAPQSFRGLSSRLDAEKGLTGLGDLIAEADVVHLQNVMNPTAIRLGTSSGRAVATVQDHRVFCPAMGKTMPDGSRCADPFTRAPCTTCIPDAEYRESMIELTQDRLQALATARLVVLSHYMAEELERVDLPRPTIIPPWVPPAKARDQPGRALLLGGRLELHKAVLTAWEAWDRGGRILPLRIAGAGRLEDQLVGAQCLGWIRQEALSLELAQARALLFPSFWQEPFGILGLQALATGTPVIVTDSGGTSDWSQAGCIKIPAGDSEAFREAILALSRNPKRALRLGQEGQVMVSERFGFDRWAKSLDTIWQETASRTPTTQPSDSSRSRHPAHARPSRRVHPKE